MAVNRSPTGEQLTAIWRTIDLQLANDQCLWNNNLNHPEQKVKSSGTKG
jgi:hypothetical protein